MNILFHDGNKYNFYKCECVDNVLTLWFGDGFGIKYIEESITTDTDKKICLNTNNNISMTLTYKSMSYVKEDSITTKVQFLLENII